MPPRRASKRLNMKGHQMKYQFRFASSYMNEIEYDCFDASGDYRVILRAGTSDYERSIFNGTPQEYERQCAAVVGYLRGRHGRRLSLAAVAAFNDWQKDKTRLALARFDAEPERYGIIAADDPIRQPLLAKGAAYWEDGWKFTDLCCVMAA